MTESEWLACSNPTPMLEFLRGKVSDRKLRLFGCASCRRLWEFYSGDRRGDVIVASEQFADGLVDQDKLNAAYAVLGNLYISLDTAGEAARWTAYYDAFYGALQAGYFSEKLAGISAVLSRDGRSEEDGRRVEKLAHAASLKDIFGNPFRPLPTIAPSVLTWNDSTIPKLAQQIYEERRFEDIPILADALMDAGSHDEEILSHCRSEGQHVRGCWVIDLLLGKS